MGSRGRGKDRGKDSGPKKVMKHAKELLDKELTYKLHAQGRIGREGEGGHCQAIATATANAKGSSFAFGLRHWPWPCPVPGTFRAPK